MHVLQNDLTYQQKTENFFISGEKKVGRIDSWSQAYRRNLLKTMQKLYTYIKFKSEIKCLFL